MNKGEGLPDVLPFVLAVNKHIQWVASESLRCRHFFRASGDCDMLVGRTCARAQKGTGELGRSRKRVAWLDESSRASERWMKVEEDTSINGLVRTVRYECARLEREPKMRHVR